MEHYIKINKYAFNTNDPTKLMVEVYFDLQDGFNTTSNGQGYYCNLDFESVHIDTEDTFICSNEWSTLSTEIDYRPTSDNATDITTETYTYLDGNTIVNSSRKLLHIEIDLSDPNLNGVLGATQSFKDKMLFFFVTVNGDYNANANSYIAQQPTTLMFSLYNPKDLYNNIYESLVNSMDIECCKCIDCSSINNIVFLHGLEASLQSEKWQEAVKYWGLLHSNHDIIKNKSCNCK